jgi:hypothetical protein
MKLFVLWDFVPRSLAESDQGLRGAYCFHHDDGGSIHL